MKSLTQFIQESMLSKNTLNEAEEEFVLVEPTSKAYDELEEEMADAMLSNNADPNMFILRREVAKDMLKKYPKDIIVYEIPGGDVEAFEADFEDGKFDYEELVKIEKL